MCGFYLTTFISQHFTADTAQIIFLGNERILCGCSWPSLLYRSVNHTRFIPACFTRWELLVSRSPCQPSLSLALCSHGLCKNAPETGQWLVRDLEKELLFLFFSSARKDSEDRFMLLAATGIDLNIFSFLLSHKIFLVIICALNLLTFIIYGADKWKARKDRWRIPFIPIWINFQIYGKSAGRSN